MANTATQFKISAVVDGVQNVESLKSAVKRLQNSVPAAASDLNQLRDATTKLGKASDLTENALRTQIAVMRDLRGNVQFLGKDYKDLTQQIQAAERQLNRASGAGSRFAKAGQTIGAVAAGGVFGGPEGLLGGAIGALGGPGGALAGAAIGAQVGMVRQQIAGITDYASSLGRLNIALREVTGSALEYAKAQEAIQRISNELNVPILEATQGFTRLTAAVEGAGGNVGDAEIVFRGVTQAIKATGGSAEDVQAALLAMSQVFSKGKVSAEELQGQLGERLPGAVTLFAQATGRTLPQLSKDLQAGTVGLNDLMKFAIALSEKYASSANKMASSTDEAGARMKVALDKLKENFGNFFKPVGAGIQDLITKMANFANEIFRTSQLTEKLKQYSKGLTPANEAALLSDATKIARGRVLSRERRDLPLSQLSNDERAFLDKEIYGSSYGALTKSGGILGQLRRDFMTRLGYEAGALAKPVLPKGPSTFQSPKPEGDDKTAKDAIRSRLELNRLEQQRLNALYDQRKVGKDQLTQLQLEKDQLWFISRLKLQAIQIENKSKDLQAAGMSALAQEHATRKAEIEDRKKRILEDIDKIAKESGKLNKSIFEGVQYKTPLEETYDRIDEKIQNAIDRQKEFVKQLNEKGGLNPEQAAQRANVLANISELINVSPEQKRIFATRDLAGGDIESFRQRNEELRRSGRELTALDELVIKYGEDWKLLDPTMRQQLELLAQQHDQLMQNLQLQESVINPLRAGLTDTFNLLVDGTESWGNSLRSIAAGVLKDIAKQLLQILVIEQAINALRGVLGGLFPGGGGGGGLGSLDANIAQYAPLAKGGVFAANGIIPFAMGGIVDKPMIFPFAKGVGLMGEAGPEAIIPLRRGRDGKLGVAGGGGTSVVVNVDAKGTSVQGDDNRGQQLGRAVSQAVQAELIKQKRPGGLLAA